MSRKLTHEEIIAELDDLAVWRAEHIECDGKISALLAALDEARAALWPEHLDYGPESPLTPVLALLMGVKVLSDRDVP